MARGISLHIGVNDIDQSHYKGYIKPLSSCENDADTMLAIAQARGFEASQLKSQGATRQTVIDAFAAAASELHPGDMFLVTYSGHGGQVRDVDGDEADGKDDTWCLYDAQLLDDELNLFYSKFRPGVRVLVISDSCHSGTMLKRASESSTQEFDENEISRAMPRSAARATQRENKSFYADIQEALPRPRPTIEASVRLLSGCQEHELSWGTKVFGRFTHALQSVYANGGFSGDYHAFHSHIVEAISSAPNKQTPGHAFIGNRGKRDEEFDRQPPFQL